MSCRVETGEAKAVERRGGKIARPYRWRRSVAESRACLIDGGLFVSVLSSPGKIARSAVWQGRTPVGQTWKNDKRDRCQITSSVLPRLGATGNGARGNNHMHPLVVHH